MGYSNAVKDDIESGLSGADLGVHVLVGATACSAWWMYDNHTFKKVDLADPNWRLGVMQCYDLDGYGSFFVRDAPNGKEIFSLHGRGKKGRDAFAAALDLWEPPNMPATAKKLEADPGI